LALEKEMIAAEAVRVALEKEKLDKDNAEKERAIKAAAFEIEEERQILRQREALVREEAEKLAKKEEEMKRITAKDQISLARYLY